MELFKLTKKFKQDEDGAVTVDWVVLTAAIVGLGIAVIAAVRGGVTSLGEEINTSLSSASIDELDLNGGGTGTGTGTGTGSGTGTGTGG